MFTFKKKYGFMRSLHKIDGDYLRNIKVGLDLDLVEFAFHEDEWEIWAFFLDRLRQNNRRYANLRGKIFMKLFICISDATQQPIKVHDTSATGGKEHYYEQF